MKWEYKIVECHWLYDNATKVLNNMGSEGWELVSVMLNKTGDQLLYFKRRGTGNNIIRRFRNIKTGDEVTVKSSEKEIFGVFYE